jgi:hypothetical protein
VHIQRPFTFATLVILFAALTLSACGGGGSDSGTPPVTAPSNLSYSSPQVYSVGTAITTLTPTVTGTVSSYAVSPALPAGLTLNTTSGAISGTPTALAAQAKYTVTATNSGGSTTFDLTLTVNDMQPGAITYPAPKLALATGVRMTDLTPKVAGGGATTGWSIDPALPAGLSFRTTDGTIYGTPTADSAATTYTIAATNSGGQATYSLSLSVQSGVVVDLGHADAIVVLRFDGSRVFSVDASGHWVLWYYASGAQIASGDSTGCAGPCTADDFVGQSIVIQTAGGFEIRAASDGHVLGTIALPHPSAVISADWAMLASDGSYLVTGNTAAGGLQVWSTTGTSLLSKATGTYAPKYLYAAPGELRAAITVGGAHVIETTSIATGLSTNGPSFAGTFDEWFVDGNRFQTEIDQINNNAVTSVTVYTYSAAGNQDDVTTLSAAGNLQGTGNWFASYVGGSIYVYKVGASGTAAGSYAIQSGNYSVSPGLFSAAGQATNGGQTLTLVDVTGTTPAVTVAALPPGGGDTYPYIHTALSATQWLTGSYAGVLFDGASTVNAPRFLDYGAAWSIAGAANRFAIATASGRILHFNATTGAQESPGSIADLSTKVTLSSDGATLAAAGAYVALTGTELVNVHKTRVYSLPGEGLVSTWPANNIDLPSPDIDLSASGTVLAQTFQANSITGGAPTWTVPSGSYCATIRLSPDGTQIACADGSLNSQLFANTSGSAGTAINGIAVGWLDNGHVLVNHYVREPGNRVFDHATVDSPTGVELSQPPLPELPFVQVLGADSVYSQDRNSIYTVSSGAATWLSPTASRGIGAVAGANVVFASGHSVLSLPH